ncbi:MAG TPA: hypothetical protein VMN36_00330 [Verrucomicrobiales bacterium]|nr:hypothetical protein [Verrucomicrobiales bacterium]
MVKRSATTGDGRTITRTPAGVPARGLLLRWFIELDPGLLKKLNQLLSKRFPPVVLLLIRDMPLHIASHGRTDRNSCITIREDDMIEHACVGGGHGRPLAGTPAGVRIDLQLTPVVSLRFTTGYKLRSLRLLHRLAASARGQGCPRHRMLLPGQECPRHRMPLPGGEVERKGRLWEDRALVEETQNFLLLMAGYIDETV